MLPCSPGAPAQTSVSAPATLDLGAALSPASASLTAGTSPSLSASLAGVAPATLGLTATSTAATGATGAGGTAAGSTAPAAGSSGQSGQAGAAAQAALEAASIGPSSLVAAVAGTGVAAVTGAGAAADVLVPGPPRAGAEAAAAVVRHLAPLTWIAAAMGLVLVALAVIQRRRRSDTVS